MNSSHVLLFVVMSLLIVAIVSYCGLRASAVPPDHFFGSGDCESYHNTFIDRYYKTCCWSFPAGPNAGKITCQRCETGKDGNVTPDSVCDTVKTFRSLAGGGTTGSLNLTNAQAVPVNPPGGKITGPLNNGIAPPSNATTGNPTLKGTTGLHNLPINKAGSSNTVPDNTTILLKHKKGSSSSSSGISQSGGNINSNPSSVVGGNSGKSNNNNEHVRPT